MTRKSKKGKTISRRGIFPFLGSTLLLPFLGFGKPTPESKKNGDEEAYETLLRPDGTTVKVKTSHELETTTVPFINIAVN